MQFLNVDTEVSLNKKIKISLHQIPIICARKEGKLTYSPKGNSEETDMKFKLMRPETQVCPIVIMVVWLGIRTVPVQASSTLKSLIPSSPESPQLLDHADEVMDLCDTVNGCESR